jgi:hypothetical protein
MLRTSRRRSDQVALVTIEGRRAHMPRDLRWGGGLGSSLVLEALAKLVHRESHAAFDSAERRVGARAILLGE